MADNSQTDPARPPQPAQPPGGVSIGQSSQVNAADLVGRDKIGLDGEEVKGIIEVLLKNIPRSALGAEQLDRALGQFREYHERLHEWKELHNYLSEILRTFDSFRVQADRWTTGGSLDPLRQSWQSVNQQVEILLDWAKTIKHIGTPYRELANAREGEDWAVKIDDLQNALSEFLRFDKAPGGKSPFGGLFGQKSDEWYRLHELASSFNNATVMYLHRADKNLRDTATYLYNLSRNVLGSQEK